MAYSLQPFGESALSAPPKHLPTSYTSSHSAQLIIRIPSVTTQRIDAEAQRSSQSAISNKSPSIPKDTLNDPRQTIPPPAFTVHQQHHDDTAGPNKRHNAQLSPSAFDSAHQKPAHNNTRTTQRMGSDR